MWFESEWEMGIHYVMGYELFWLMVGILLEKINGYFISVCLLVLTSVDSEFNLSGGLMNTLLGT